MTEYKNKKEVEIGSIIVLAVLVVAAIFIWNTIQSYRNEFDYVCFNKTCDYIHAKDYSVSWLGNCLTRSDLSAEQCGGSIEIIKPKIGFFERLSEVGKAFPKSFTPNAFNY